MARPPIEPRAEPVPCPVCGDDEPRPYRDAMYRIEAMPFHLVRCPCGMVYLNPRPDGATLAWMYDDPEYYREGYTCGVEVEGYFERGEQMLAEYDVALQRIEGEIGVQAGEMIELGPAGGFFMAAAKRRGWNARGVELSPRAIEFARGELKLDIFQGELEDAPWPEGSFDLASADNVLEHTLDPAATLRTFRRFLKPGGHLLMVTPSYVNSIWFRWMMALPKLLPKGLLGPRLLKILKHPDSGEDSGYPYHILEFDRRALTRLLREAGYEIVDVEGSIPLPGHLFRNPHLSFPDRCLKGVFQTLEWFMKRDLLPDARLRVLARSPGPPGPPV